MLSLVLMSLRRSWRALPILVVFFGWAVARAESPDAAGTFPEDYLPGLKPILETALRQSYTVIAKQIELEQATARMYGANAPRLPSLGGNINYANNKSANSENAADSSSASGFFYGFGLSQALYHWGALKAESDKARINVLIAEKNYREASRVLAVSLRTKYMDLVVRKMLLQQMRYARDLLKADLDLTKDKLTRGLVSEGEVGGREFSLKEVNLRLQRTELEFAGMRRSFARLAGIASGDLPESAIPEGIAKPTHSHERAEGLLAAVVRDGGRNTFAAEVGVMRVRQAELDTKIAKTRLLPKFNAGLSYSLDNNTSLQGNTVQQNAVTRQTISVGAQWNIFDGLATKGAKLETLAAKRAAERQLQEVTEAAVDAAKMLSQQLDLDAQEIELADIRYGLSTEGLKKLRQELALGNVSQTTIDNALSEQKLREFGMATARAAYLARWSEFASLVGSDPVLNQLPARHDREKR